MPYPQIPDYLTRELQRIACEGDSLGIIMYAESIAARLLEAHPHARVSIFQIQDELVRLASLPKEDLRPLVDAQSADVLEDDDPLTRSRPIV